MDSRTGEIAHALVQAAQHGPAPVSELAARALVGRRAAWYTAHRLVRRGLLVVVRPARPAVLGLPMHAAGTAD